MAEGAVVAQVLSHVGLLKAIQQQVRFARARFGRYDLIDFVVMLLGYALSGESTLLAFYERLVPWAEPFMALFGRDRLPHRSTLSRFLAALDQPTVEALRTLFHKDLFARKPFGLLDRLGAQWFVIDVDGTRATARQRVLPQTDALPPPHRRFDQVCAPGYQGRKRGEVVRTRTVPTRCATRLQKEGKSPRKDFLSVSMPTDGIVTLWLGTAQGRQGYTPHIILREKRHNIGIPVIRERDVNTSELNRKQFASPAMVAQNPF